MGRSLFAFGALGAGSITISGGRRFAFTLAFSLALTLPACGGATAPERSVVASEDGGGGDASGPPVLQCQAGWAVCEGSCTNLQSDSNHCGTCGIACGSGTRCRGGTCVARPTQDAGAGSGLPPDPGGPTPGAGAPTVNMAISLLRYGDTDRNGVASATAWQLYGLDLDGKTTTQQSTDVCILQPGAPKSVQVDGPGGIDNSFGENIVPILQTLTGNFSQQANTNLLAGDATPILSIPQLGAGQNYSPLPGTVFRAAPTTAPLAWNGMDLRDIDVGTPPVAFAGGYMNQRVWVGAPPAAALLFDLHDFAGLATPGTVAPLPLSYAQLDLLVEPNGLSATGGTVAAVIETKAMITWLESIAGEISMSLCSGSAFMSIAAQISQASDIVLNPDGTVSNDPGNTCNAISLGMGFEGTGVQLGGPVMVPPPTNLCP
jgi:hypothetical protein